MPGDTLPAGPPAIVDEGLPRDTIPPDVMREDTLSAGSVVGILPTATVSATLEVDGEFRPGTPLSVTGFIAPLVLVESVSAKLWAPEVESARISGVGDDYRIQLGQTISPFAEQSASGLLAGAFEISGTLTIPWPGMYEVVLSITSNALNVDFAIGETIQRSVWVYVTESGGGTYDDFDSVPFPSDVVGLPGPRRFFPTPDQLGSESPSASPSSLHQPATVVER